MTALSRTEAMHEVRAHVEHGQRHEQHRRTPAAPRELGRLARPAGARGPRHRLAAGAQVAHRTPRAVDGGEREDGHIFGERQVLHRIVRDVLRQGSSPDGSYGRLGCTAVTGGARAQHSPSMRRLAQQNRVPCSWRGLAVHSFVWKDRMQPTVHGNDDSRNVAAPCPKGHHESPLACCQVHACLTAVLPCCEDPMDRRHSEERLPCQ